MGKMKNIWAGQSYDDSMDDYLYMRYIEEETERKALKRKKYIAFYYKNKAQINKYNQEKKRSKNK